MITRLVVSFSGGKTSALMSIILKDIYELLGYKEIIFVFANTGLENEKTLAFVDRCDKEYNLNVIYLEAEVVHEKGKGTKHKVVDFRSASRKGEPFEQAIIKFGIPNSHFPHCTRELKQRPIYSYLREIGWAKGTYHMAIGIRTDEMDRFSSTYKEEGIIYPLFTWNIDKQIVNGFWYKNEFTLELEEEDGNCKTCWKKSFRKLHSIALKSPEHFEFMNNMEEKYGYNGPGEKIGPRKFFRGNKSTIDILNDARLKKISEDHDRGSGCSETCEPFADEHEVIDSL